MARFGGFCNNLMNSRLPSSIITLVEKEIDYIPISAVEELIRSIFPTIFFNKEGSIYENLIKAILSEHQVKFRSSPEIKQAEVNSGIVQKALKCNQNLARHLDKLLSLPQIMEFIRTTLPKREKEQIIIDPYNRLLNKSVESRSDPSGVLSKMRNPSNLDVFKPSSQKYQFSSSSRITENKEECKNLLYRPQCICVNQKPIFNKDEVSLQCIHCKRLFHTVCMKRKSNFSYCIYCHIERMMPLKKVKKTVYIGLFRRNFRKHIASMFIPAIEPNQKFQIRCLRLKQGAPTACLFPDIASITMNGHHIKQFEPVNKASCLKYRKDEPFNLMKGDYYSNQENILILNESCSTFKEKQIRYDTQNHLFGVFVTEDIKIASLIEEIKEQNIMGYTESSEILKESFAKFGGGDQDITCQLVKIPLSCPLSTVRIDIPVRGIFCTHFQCFDLKNFLTLISDSGNPRWNCPLCRSFAYQLQIDPILLQILKSIKENDKIQEILFFKNGDYTAIVDEEPDPNRKNIRNLNIPEKKRKLVNQEIFEQEKPIKKQFVIPENAQVISLDD